MSPHLVDAAGRERIHSDLAATFIVEAAAGTGKTTVLVNRIVAVLECGDARIDSVVAVTFTEKAAGELKLRMRSELEKERQRATDERQLANLEDALARLEEAWVGTIHGFCADLLRERSVEARVDPRFQTLTEAEAQRLYRDAFQLWLQERLENPPEGVRRSLRRSSTFGSDGPVGRLRSAGWTLTAWRDFPAPWKRHVFAREEQIDGLVDRLLAFADLTARADNPRDNFYRDSAAARRLGDAVRTAEAVRERDYDGLEAAFIDLARERNFKKPRKGRGRYAEGVKRSDVLEAHDAFLGLLEAFAAGADADLAALLHAELRETIDRYEMLKERSGRVDFVDLLIRARDLIRDHQEVRRDFQQRFTHIFVDEFQDTDPLQAEILLLLAARDPGVSEWRDVDPAPGKLFLVADPKQSIYRFRRADVGIYLEVKELLLAAGADCIELTTSFRSVPSIQHAVNRAFAPLMDGDRDAYQAQYVPLSPVREDPTDQPAVVALPVPRPYGYRGIAKYAIEQSLPDAVGAFVEWLLNDSAWTVSDRDHPGERVPIVGRHICLLFRRFSSFGSDVTRSYVQALESRGIRHLLVGGHSFHAREEVETIRTALAAIEWPDDELSVFATLRGSLFAVGDEELLEYRHRFKRLHPFRIPDDDLTEPIEPIARALELLGALHRRRNHRPLAETISLLLEKTRAHAGFVLRPSGEQALANVLHVAEQARAYEGAGGISFRGFVEQLLEDAGGGRTAEAPILEEGSDGVRIMTTHKAKGLEFPVVILADMTANLTSRSASRWIDPVERLCAVRLAGWSPAELLEHESEELLRDAAEAIRISYVAATRARDLLVVPGVGDGPEAGWISTLNEAIYPPREKWNAPEPALGCPEFGNDTTVTRPDAFFVGGIKPGRHAFPDDGYGVVWWDPTRLRIDVEPIYGVRQADLIGKDTDASIVDADLAAHRGWQERHDQTLASAGRPSLEVVSATAQARRSREDAPAPAIEVIELPGDATRPGGPRFGTLVHAVIASVPLTADESGVAATARLQGRILGASDEETAAAVQIVVALLAHELMERARTADGRGECRRETPITIIDADAEGVGNLDGTLVEGVVDLAFLEDGRWTVVDFKTDRQVDRERRTYERQLELYVRAIARATGQGADGVLVSL